LALAIRAFKKFDAADFGAFLKLLPKERDGQKLMHVVEVRHESFLVPEFVELLRAHNVAVRLCRLRRLSGDGRRHADFVYARLQRTEEKNATGYAPPTSIAGRRSPRPGKPAARRTGSNASPKKPRRKEAAGFSLHDRRAPRCARRPPRWR